MFSLVILLLLAALAIAQGYITRMFTPRGRKFLYGGAILLLFFAMLFHRGEVEAAADEHSLRETNIGKVDLDGSTARFVLASFRGPLICILWWDATELQMKHEYQAVELRYKSLNKLQPHFRQPWIYQAWNLAYNVSVEFDRVEDKYFYITQGLRWLAEGEQLNRAWIRDPLSGERKEIGDPDMRWSIGFTLQDKFSVSDEVNTHRCFLHLSCIPPTQWDPVRLRQSADQFEEFVKSHPQLVRQFRLLRNIPAGADRQLRNELLTFFAAHRRLPSLYPGQVDGEKLDPDTVASLRFPVWPGRKDLQPLNPELEDNHDAHDIAMRWYIFANEPLPPPSLDLSEHPEEARYYRMPTRMMSLIFRKQAAQAKAHQAMQLGKDGWFEQSQSAWKQALEMWLTFARENRIELRDYDATMERAQRYYRRFPEEAMAGLPPPRLFANDPEVSGDFQAYLDLRHYEERRRHANYVHWKTVSEVGARDDATAARRHMYNGNVNRSNFRLAMQEYELGLAGWKKLLVKSRPIDPKRDVTFLLGMGPGDGFQQAFVVQPLDVYDRTEFGEDTTVNDELVELQDQYIRVRCRALGMGTVQAGQSIWQMGMIISRQLGGFSGPGAVVGANLSPITMTFAESSLQYYVAPLDLYLIPGYAYKSYRFKPSAPPPPSAAGGQ